MNLLTTCALTGALATSFFVRPTVGSPAAAPTPAPAVEVQKGKKFENATWSRVVNISFHPGKRAEAIRIIQDHFRPASFASNGPQALAFEHVTGEYDLTAIWELPEGTDSLDWDVSPSQAAWRSALEEQLGGAEKAKELLDTYRSYIRKSEVTLVRTLKVNKPGAVEKSGSR